MDFSEQRAIEKDMLICAFMNYWGAGIVPSLDMFMRLMDDYCRKMTAINKREDESRRD